MPRIRTVKPEFWQDEKMARLPPLTRLVFLGLISMSDDAGRLVDSVKLIDGFVFPETDDSCREALETLASLSRICRYTSGSGQRLIQVTNWSRHQFVPHPSRYNLPAPAPEDLRTHTVIKSSCDPHANGTQPSCDPHAPIYDQRPTIIKEKTLSADEQAVVDHYKHCHPKRLRGDLPSKTLRLLRKALKSYSVDDLNQAIDHNAASTFHREHNFMGLELILRDSEKIDFFLGLTNGGKPDVVGSRFTDETIQYID